MSSNDWTDELGEQEPITAPTAKLFRSQEENGELPRDIAEVWAGNPMVPLFIKQWGLETFRSSKLHQLALIEHQRQMKLGPIRQSYLKKSVKK